jgi:transposase-like protein
MGKSRRKFTAEQKASILREHLIEKVSVADLCEKHGLQPTVFYRWQKEMTENPVAPFAHRGRESKAKKFEEQIGSLREKLTRKDVIIAEIMEDCVAAKKHLAAAEAIPGLADGARRRRPFRSALCVADGVKGRSCERKENGGGRIHVILPTARSPDRSQK